jgi:hypothetical protein
VCGSLRKEAYLEFVEIVEKKSWDPPLEMASSQGVNTAKIAALGTAGQPFSREWTAHVDAIYCAFNVIDYDVLLASLEVVLQAKTGAPRGLGEVMWNETPDGYSTGFSRAASQGIPAHSIMQHFPVDLPFDDAYMTDDLVEHDTMRILHPECQCVGVNTIAAGWGPAEVRQCQTELMRAGAGGSPIFWVLSGSMDLCLIDDSVANLYVLSPSTRSIEHWHVLIFIAVPQVKAPIRVSVHQHHCCCPPNHLGCGYTCSTDHSR